MNTFSRRLDFVFINLVISYKCSHLLYILHLECHTSLIYGFLYFAEQLDHLITHL